MRVKAIFGATALIGIGAFVLWTAFRVINAPPMEEAMRRSLTALGRPELEIAYALHPDACSITKVSIWKWTATCEGVPMHFYEEIKVCDPGPPKVCSADPSRYEDCRSFFWDIDLDGNPSDPIGHRPKYASMSSDCRPKGTIASERMEMARRGMLLNPVEIMDYAGSLTGKPRPMSPANR